DGAGIYPTNVSPGLLVEGTNVLAVEIHQNTGTSSDISFDLELVGVPSIPRNQPPMVALTAPTNGAYFLAPASLTLAASGSDPDGTVVKLEFFVDGAKLGESTNSSDTFIWNGPPIGWHQLQAIATDDQGASTASTSVGITIYDSFGTPLVQIINPANNAVFDGPTNLLLTAIASAVGAVTNVAFYAASNLIGSSSAFATANVTADYGFEYTLASSFGTAPAFANLRNK